MNIIWIAPPAAGKGTFCTMLKERHGFNHISAGELLREQVNLNTSIGNEIKEILETGGMVDDNLMKKLVKNKLETLDLNIPFMLDGYPRKMNQVKDYEETLKSFGLEVDKVIFINIDKATGLNRILGRLSCPKCKRNYNKSSGYMKPINDNLCDVCNIPLVSRSDDTKETYETRYDIYIKETKSVIEYFRNLGKLIEINGTEDPNITIKIIEDLLGVNNG